MKYYYVEEYCKPYRQLMPVKYEKGDDELWHKTRMACSNVDTCKKECRHFKIAPDVVTVDKLRDKRIGE